jgi:hypothetical protein
LILSLANFVYFQLQAVCYELRRTTSSQQPQRDRQTSTSDPARPRHHLRGTGLLRWSHLASVLAECAGDAPRADERAYAQRAVDWLKGKRIGGAT